MSEQFKKIIDWFNKIRSTQFSYEKKGIRPSRDWKIILGASLFFILVLVFVSAYFYLEVDNGSFFLVEQDKTENYTKINIDLLNKTIKDIKERQDNFAKVNSGVVTVSDPSV